MPAFLRVPPRRRVDSKQIDDVGADAADEAIAIERPDIVRLDLPAQRVDQFEIRPRRIGQEKDRGRCGRRASTWRAPTTRAWEARSEQAYFRGSTSAPIARMSGACQRQRPVPMRGASAALQEPQMWDCRRGHTPARPAASAQATTQPGAQRSSSRMPDASPCRQWPRHPSRRNTPSPESAEARIWSLRSPAPSGARAGRGRRARPASTTIRVARTSSDTRPTSANPNTTHPSTGDAQG